MTDTTDDFLDSDEFDINNPEHVQRFLDRMLDVEHSTEDEETPRLPRLPLQLGGAAPTRLILKIDAVGANVRQELCERWEHDPEAAMANLPRAFAPCETVDIDEMYRKNAGLLMVLEAVAEGIIPGPGYPLEDLERLIRSLVAGQRNDMKLMRPGSWCVAPDNEHMPSDARVDFAFTPTYAVIALFTLVKERHFRLVRRIPGFRSAMSAGYRFSTLRGLQGHGYESWDGMMDALEILRTGKVIAYADAHPRFSVPFTKALHKLRTGICADYARGRRTGFHGVPVTLSGLRWFVDVAVHGEPALERARNPDELASRLDRLRHYLPGEVVSRWESRLGEWLCELLADQHDLEALAERLETPWNMLSPAAQIMWRTRLGELAVDGLSGEPDFYVLAQRYDKLRRHLPDAVRGAWLDRLLELGDQANFRTLITVIHVFLEGESEERRRAFKELQHRKARTIDDLQWLRKDCDEFVDLQLDAVRQEAALTFDARALSSLARELHRLGGDETEVREWFQRALEIADLGGKRAVASKVMETLRDKRWGHAILREIGDLRPMPSKV